MGSLDAGIAQLLEDDGIGDFSSTADVLTRVPPVIVIGQMSEKPDAMVAVLPASGPQSNRILGRFPRYQVITRDLGYDVARDRAEAIHQSLDQHQGALDGEPVGRIQPDFEPIPLSRDGTGIEGGRVTFTQTFTVFTK